MGRVARVLGAAIERVAVMALGIGLLGLVCHLAGLGRFEFCLEIVMLQLIVGFEADDHQRSGNTAVA